MPRLRVSGSEDERVVEVSRALSVGRLDADETFDDPEISRRHMAVRAVPGALEIEDLGSANGTFVDGARIDGPTKVGNGAKIRIGRTVLIVEEVTSSQETRITTLRDTGATVTAQIGESRPSVDEDIPDATRIGQLKPVAAPARTRGARPAQSPVSPTPRVPRATGVATGDHIEGVASNAIGEFRVNVRRRGPGLATRSWVPPVVSYGSVIVVAIALVIFFSSR